MFTVSIVSPDRSLAPIDKVIAEHDFGCQFHKYIYNDLSDIDAIYADCQNTCDVIFFSDELGYHYIRHRFLDIRVPCAFTAYGTNDVLAILLNFTSTHSDIPLERVFVDFLTPMNNFMDLPRYIPAERLPYFFDDSPYDYQHITARTVELWESGKIDMVISRSINNLPRLDELGIPYLAVFPSEAMIQGSIEAALNDLRLNRIEPTEHLVMSIRLPYGEDCPQEEREYREATLYKLLVDVRREMDQTFSIQQSFNLFELHALVPAQTVDAAWLRTFFEPLRSKIEFSYRVGVGLHANLERSHYYAEQALLEASRHGRNDAFFVSGEEGALTGPLSAESALTYQYGNKKAVSFARYSGISESNLLKLTELFQAQPEEPLTAAAVSRLLGITPRSANRILQKLVALDLACPLVEKKPGRKGRPVRRYQFCPEAFRQALL